jgi:hypothetical protein
VFYVRSRERRDNAEWSGVWVSDRPLDNSEGANGEALLQIDIAEDLLTAFEWVEEGKPPTTKDEASDHCGILVM